MATDYQMTVVTPPMTLPVLDGGASWRRTATMVVTLDPKLVALTPFFHWKSAQWQGGGVAVTSQDNLRGLYGNLLITEALLESSPTGIDVPWVSAHAT